MSSGRDAGPREYPEVEELIAYFAAAVTRALGENLVGLYLTGSLSYDAFERRSSDIDLTAIVRRPSSDAEISSLRGLHRETERRFPEWSKRLECTYTPVDMLPSVRPPGEGRPWYWGGEGQLYAAAVYGNEWIINRYFLYEHAIALQGPEFRDLAGPVDIHEVQKACVRDLFVEWKPKASSYPHRAYLVLNLCRILYTVRCAAAGSKQVAARWVLDTYGDRWRELVESALAWGHGDTFEPHREAAAFLSFVVSEVSATPVYAELAAELGAA